MIPIENPEVKFIRSYGLSDENPLIYGAGDFPYNGKVVSYANADMYCVLEWDVPVVGNDPLLIPTPASGWHIYDEGKKTITIDGEDKEVYQYILIYSNGESMTRLAAGAETGNVFNSVAIKDGLTEDEYRAKNQAEIHGIARTVLCSQVSGEIDAVVAAVPSGY